ncbi:MAG: GNAT family N-acetyltransferase [Chitinophagaceae bacterium]|nr:GNAT family N-acetyltransferase [Chitinophagaceae bacterium]
MPEISSQISILPYGPLYRQGCLNAFESNTPKYFTWNEVGQFNQWLDHLEGKCQLYDGEDSHYFVALLHNQVVGCGGFGYSPEKDQATLAWGLIHNSNHKQHIGSALLSYRLNRIGEMYPTAVVLLDTTQFSYPFFQRHGFVIEKITKDSYAPGMDRYDMKWEKK